MALRSTDLFLVGRGVASYKFSAESLGNYYRSSFIPLTGTLETAPITGDIEFQGGKKILFGSDGNGLTIKNDYWGGLFYTDQLQFEFGRNGLKAGTDLQMKIGTSSDSNPRNRITFLADPQDMYDAATKKYVDDKYEELDLDNIQLDSYLPLAGGVMSGLLVNDEISVGPYPTTRIEDLEAEPLTTSDVTPTLYLNTGTLTADSDALGSDLTDLAGWYLDAAAKPNNAEPYGITRVEFDGEESSTGYAYIYHHKYDSPDYYYTFDLDDDVRDWTKVSGSDVRGIGSRFYGIISTRLDDGTVRYISLTNRGFSWKDNDFRGDGWTQSSGGVSYQSVSGATNGLLAIGVANNSSGAFSTDGGKTANNITFPNNLRPCTPLAFEDGFLFNETYLSSGTRNKLWYTENGTNFTSVNFSDIVTDSNLGLTDAVNTGSGSNIAKAGDYYYVTLNNKSVARSKTPLDSSTYELLPKFTKDVYGINVVDENLIIINLWASNYHPVAVVNGDWDNLQEFDFLVGYTPKGSYNYLDFVSDDNEAVMLFSGYRLVRYRNDDFSFSGTGEQHIYWNNEKLATVADLRSVLHYVKDEFNKDENELAQKLEDAPSDGETYVRKDGEWVQEESFDDSHLLQLAGGTVTGDLVLNPETNDDTALTIEKGKIVTKANVEFNATKGDFNFRGGAQTDGQQNYINVFTGAGSKLFEIKRGFNMSLSDVQYFGGVTNPLTIATKGYVDEQIDNLGDVLTFKGAIDFTVTVAPTNPSVGDVYANNGTGTPDESWGITGDVVSGNLYGKGANEWGLIGGAEIDLTGYATETYVNVQTAMRVPLNISSLEELPD